jgi:hypothetical protein
MIAYVHERTIGGGLPHLIDFSWATADTFRRSLRANEQTQMFVTISGLITCHSTLTPVARWPGRDSTLHRCGGCGRPGRVRSQLLK